MESNFRRIYAIPDVHGRLDLLDRALELMDSDGYDRNQDALVFLGDLIDRGPDSKGVIDLVIALMKDSPNSVMAVRGNHEDFPVNLYVHKLSWARKAWMYNGMIQTLESYDFSFPNDHLQFLLNRPYSIEIQGFFFSHAPVPCEAVMPEHKPGMPYSVEDLTWTYIDINTELNKMHLHKGPRSNGGTGGEHLIGVCGHIHRGTDIKQVRIYPKYRMLDCGSGCFGSGKLAVHECISGRTLYADPNDLK